MDLEELRRSLKIKWLRYYQENRDWLVKLGIWITVDGQRRPSSSFVVATLVLLEPQLMQILPLIVDLNHNPDQIVQVLGLNFSPETELRLLQEPGTSALILPADSAQLAFQLPSDSHPISKVDEACQGTGRY